MRMENTIIHSFETRTFNETVDKFNLYILWKKNERLSFSANLNLFTTLKRIFFFFRISNLKIQIF